MSKELINSLILATAPGLAYCVVKLLSWTMKIEVINGQVQDERRRSGEPSIGAFWHGRLLMMPAGYRGKRMTILISRHRDGELISRTVKYFRFKSIRGSTTRGGLSAMREMMKASKEGYDIAITPDGPRGPRYRVQNGIIELARRMGIPIIPVTFNASRKKVFRSWDRFLLPYPFSRGVFIWGEPLLVPRQMDGHTFEQKRLLLERRLREITERADRYFEKGPANR
ncbi:MAG: lysophospholipid acyltransferase family protein [Syntrophobacterales bacterium]|nr:MAG: lysophospholipid acyltransferase family protein [Syntrophobacterales bacterium]